MNVSFYAFAAALSLFLSASAFGNDDDKLRHERQEQSIAIAREAPYKQLLTQHAPDAKALKSSLLIPWILDEINHDSLMRDQIGVELADIESNGHNTNWITFYYGRDKEYHAHLEFKADAVTVKCTGTGGPGIYHYQATLKAKDAYHHGMAVLSFNYTFDVKAAYFPFTKAYEVHVISYPLYVGKKSVEVED